MMVNMSIIEVSMSFGGEKLRDRLFNLPNATATPYPNEAERTTFGKSTLSS